MGAVGPAPAQIARVIALRPQMVLVVKDAVYAYDALALFLLLCEQVIR